MTRPELCNNAAQVKYFDVEPGREGEFRRKDGQTTCPECDRKTGFGKGWQCNRCETWFCDEECGDPEDGKSACWSCSDGFCFPHIILLCPVEAYLNWTEVTPS